MENSSFGRLISILISPKATFESIRERPTWLVAFLVTCLVAMTVGVLAHTRTDQREVVERRMERSGQEISAEQLETAVRMQEKIGLYAIPIGTPLFVGFFVALLSLVYWVVGKMTGTEPTFKQMFSMTLYSGAPSLIAGILQAIVILPKKTLPFEQAASRNYLPASSLGILAPEDASAQLVALLSSFDFFQLWGIVLLFFGLKIVGRMSTTVAAVVAILIFLIGLGMRVGASFLV
jgi:hypothetical protein